MSLTTPTGLPGDLTGEVMSQVLEFAPNGFALTMGNGSIVLVNAELERMFGYSRAAAARIAHRTPAARAFSRRPCTAAGWQLERLQASQHGGRPRVLRLRADGSEFPIEIGINALQTPRGAMIVETIADISVRKRLERMFQKIVEAAPCGIVMIDNVGSIAMVNPQAESMFGYERSELIGNPLEILLPERLREAHGGHRQAFGSTPAIRQMGVGRDLTARRKDGSEFPVEIGLNPVAGSEEGLVLAMVTDITGRNTMQLELRQANANLEAFMYAASHDLKSPLSGISDLVEWIAEDLGTGVAASVAHNLVRVSDRVRRLNRVIDDLLAYARAGATSADEAMLDPQAAIDAVLEILQRPPGILISASVTAQPFVTSRAPLESMLRNLISNAVNHHDRPAGSIDIRIHDEGRYCVFEISDDGPGIPPAYQERAFRMFQSSHRSDRGHSGIGLALTKRLVEAHGGWIKLDSAEGVRGTTFTIWWPRFQWRKNDD